MAQEQDMYWDEEAQEFVVYAQPKKQYGALYTVAYFLLLAIIVVPAQHFHMGMQGIFAAMVIAALVLAACVLLFKFVKSRIAALSLTPKGFVQMMVGVAPETDGNATDAHTNRSIVPASTTALVPLQGSEGDEPPDQIIEDYPLFIAEPFQPSVNSFLGTMSLLCGIRRSGKSNLLAVLVEELGRYGVPVVIFDTEDEYGSLASKKYVPNPVHAGDPGIRRESPNKDNYVDVDIEGAYAFGQAVLDHRLQAIINLKSWQDDDAAIIMSEIITGMNEWEEARENEDRLPVMVFLDEAQKWLPQNLRDSWLTRDNQGLLHHAFFDIVVARGGKRGFGLVCATQRYSQLNKNVLQSQWKFLFKQTELIDVDNYRKQGLDPDEVTALRQGECFIFSPLVIGFKAIIRKRHSPHLANTPGLENLMRTSRKQKLLTPPQSFAGVEGNAQVIDERMPDLEPKPTARQQRPKTDMEKVIEVYRENPGLSYREIGEKVGFGKDKVGELLKEAKERGLLD